MEENTETLNNPQEEVRSSKVSMNDANYLINYGGATIKDLDPKVVVLEPDVNKIPRRFMPEDKVALVISNKVKPPEDLMNVLRERTTLAKVGEDTLVSVSQRCAKNIIANLDRFDETTIISKLNKPLEGMPAFIVGAGPSLDKNVHLLSECKKHGIVFGVDAAAGAMVAQGVEADVMVCLESKEVSHYLTYNHPDPYRILAVDITCSPANWDIPCERRVTFANSDPAYSESILHFGGVPISYGGSVSLTAFSLAYFLGCDPIIFIGQDLGYTDMRTYASNTIFAEQTINRLKSDDKYMGDKIEFIGCPERGRHTAISMIDVPAWGGGSVITSHEMLTYRDWLTEASHHCNVTIINATEGGVHIPDTREMTLEDAFRYTGKRWDIDYGEHLMKAIDKHQNPTKEEIAAYKDSMRTRIRNIIRYIGESRHHHKWDSDYNARQAIFDMSLVEAFMVEWAVNRRRSDTMEDVLTSHDTQQKAVMNGCCDMLFALEGDK